MNSHDIKCHSVHFQRIKPGELPAQLRKNDCNYQPGDLLILREYEPIGWDGNGSPIAGRYTGESHKVLINRVFNDLPGLQLGYVLLTHRALVER